MSISVDLLPLALGFYRDGWFNTDPANVNDASDATGAATNGGGALSYTVDPLPAGATEVVSVTLRARLSASTPQWNGIIAGYLLRTEGGVPVPGLLPSFDVPGFSIHVTTTVTEYSALISKTDGTPWTPAEVNGLQPVLWVFPDDGFDYHAPNEGRGLKIWLTVVYNDVPPEPTSLSASVATPTQVDLAWTDNASNETSHRVERADGPGGAFASIATPAANAVTYSDTTIAPNTVYAYRVFSVNASGDSEPSNIVTLSVGVVAPDQALFSKNNALGRFETIENVRHHGYEAGVYVGLTAIRFNIGAGEIGPTNFALLSDAKATAAAVQVAMRAAGSGNETCTYSNSTHKFTVGKAAGTLSLLIQTSTHKHIGIWKYLGYNLDADRTGSLSYVADNPTYENAEKDHLLLVSLNGFRDDASGTYTGSVNGRIEKAPDVARVLIERYGPLPVSKIVTSTFVAGRTHLMSAVPLFVWVQEREELEKILERIENGACSHIVMDSEGSVHYVPYSDTTVRRAFFDRDYLDGSFRAHKVKSNVYRGVRLHYGIRPHNGQRDAVEWTSTQASVLHSRKEMKDVVTYIRDRADAETCAAKHGALATASPIEVEFTSRSKLVDLKLADLIELTRDRCAVSPTGDLQAQKFKVVALMHNYGTGVSTCVAVEHITLP